MHEPEAKCSTSRTSYLPFASLTCRAWAKFSAYYWWWVWPGIVTYGIIKKMFHDAEHEVRDKYWWAVGKDLRKASVCTSSSTSGSSICSSISSSSCSSLPAKIRSPNVFLPCASGIDNWTATINGQWCYAGLHVGLHYHCNLLSAFALRWSTASSNPSRMGHFLLSPYSTESSHGVIRASPLCEFKGAVKNWRKLLDRKNGVRLREVE